MITDERFKTRATRAIALQEQGLFILDYRQELPLQPKTLENLRYSRDLDENGQFYDYETEWGKFSFDPESRRDFLVLHKGTPPQL